MSLQLIRSILVNALGIALIVLTMPSRAQQAPLPPVIKIVVPATAGSATDIFARAVSTQLQTRTGSTVVVENKPGASTLLGSAFVAHGPKDGSSLLLTSTTLLSAAASMKDPPLNVINELAPVAMLMKSPLIVAVSNQSNIKTPSELVAAARVAPDALTHGTTGVGSMAHVAQEMLGDSAKIKIKHIPYKGASAAVTDMAAGVIDMVIGLYTSVSPGIRAGRARAIAVTSSNPSPAFPGLPTMGSAAPGFSFDLWIGVFAATGTPAPVIHRLNRDINEIAKSDKLKELMTADGGVPLIQTPEEIEPSLRNSFAAFKKIVVEKNISAE